MNVFCMFMLLCSDSYPPVLFIALIIISHRFIRDCVYIFLFFFWLCTLYQDLDPYWICTCICLLPAVFSGFVCCLYILFIEQFSSSLVLPTKRLYTVSLFKATSEFATSLVFSSFSVFCLNMPSGDAFSVQLFCPLSLLCLFVCLFS